MVVVLGKNQMKVDDDEFQHDGMMVVVDRNQQKVHDVMVVVDRNRQQAHDDEDRSDGDDVDLPKRLMEVVDKFHRVLDILVVRIHCVHVEEVVDKRRKVLDVLAAHVHYDDDDEMD